MLKLDLIPFTNYELEAFTVGAVIKVPELLDDVSTLVTEEDFYYEDTKLIFTACKELHTTNRLESRTLLEWLRQNDREGFGSNAARMVNSVPAPRLAKEYAQRVAMLSMKRKASKLSEQVLEMVETFEGYDTAKFMSEISGMVGDMDSNRGGNMTQVKSYYRRHISEKETKTIVEAPKTGLADIDSWSRGIVPKQLIIVAGRPGTGKTAFSLQVAQNISQQSFGAVPVFSMEMGIDELTDRVTSNLTGIPFLKLKHNDLTKEERQTCRLLEPKISEHFYVDDKASMDLGYITSQCRKLKRQSGKLGAVVIDYLGLMDSNRKNGESLSEAIGRMTVALKKLARELNTSIFLLVQMNREIEKRSTKRPVLSDLRDSGSIEQDADMVIFLHKDEEKSDPKMSHIDLIVAKGRNTGVRDFELAFLVEIQRLVTKAVYAPMSR